MIINYKVKILLSILLVIISNFCSSQTDEDLILKSFETFKNALNNKNGELASEFIDSESLKYYSKILSKVKTADSLELDSMFFMNKMDILTLRHIGSKQDLLNFTSSELFSYMVKNDFFENSFSNIELKKIIVDDKFSKAEFTINGQFAGKFYIFFSREDKIWKIDQAHFRSLLMLTIIKMVERSGKSENEFIIKALEFSTGNKPERNIWEPLL